MVSKRIERILNISHEAALRSRYGGYRFGSTILMGKRVISVGINSRRTHPLGAGINLAMHAELDAIRIAESRVGELDGATIAIARAGSDDGFLPSFPCAACLGRIIGKHIRRIIYIGSDLRPMYIDTRSL